MLSHGRENLRESDVLLDNFFLNQKRDMTYQSRDQSVLNTVLIRFESTFMS